MAERISKWYHSLSPLSELVLEMSALFVFLLILACIALVTLTCVYYLLIHLLISH